MSVRIKTEFKANQSAQNKMLCSVLLNKAFERLQSEGALDEQGNFTEHGESLALNALLEKTVNLMFIEFNQEHNEKTHKRRS